MSRRPRVRRGRHRAPALLVLVSAASLAAPAVAAAGGALPWDAWFVRHQLLFGERPALSPDGRFVAYSVVAARPGGSQGTRYLPSGTPGSMDGSRIAVVEVTGGAPRDPCPAEGSCWRPSWSPDGGRLAFYADAGGEVRLWIHDLATGTSRPAVPAGVEARIKARIWSGDDARWSPDGRRVYVPLAPVGAGEAEPGAEGRPAAEEAGGGTAGPPAGPAVTVRRSGAEKDAAPPAAAAEAAPEDPTARIIRRENASRLAAVDLADGRLQVLVPDTAEPTPSVLRLSPSGAWVSYLSVFRQEGGGAGKFPDLVADLAVVPAAGGPVRLVAEALKSVESDYFGANYRWHPREDRLVYLKEGELFAVDLRGGGRRGGPGGRPEPRKLAASLGALAPEPLLFTADGRSVVVGVAAEGGDGVRALALVPLDGPAGRPPVVLPLDPESRRLVGVVRGTSRTAWQPEGDALTLLEEDRTTGETVAVRVDPATGGARELWRRLGRLRGTSAGGSGTGFLVGVYEDPGTPPDVYRFGPELGSPTRVSTVEPAFDAVRGVDVQVLETRVPAPGPDPGGELRPVRTAILLPAGTEPGARLPAVVAIYPGQPVSRSAGHFAGGDFTTLPNLLFTSRGYAVVVPDLPLGPEGEPGEPVREMVDALLPQLQHAADAGWIDAGRLGLLGQSFGGYGAAAIVSRTSLFRAAVAISGIFDLPGIWGHPDRYGGSFFREWVEGGQGHMGAPPWAELPRYLANSPYYQVEHIHTPLLLVHGTDDDGVDESRKLFTALDRLGRTAQYAEYEGEGHVIWGWRLADAADAARRVTEFFARYLGAP